MTSKSHIHFPGLNSLRAYAALIVILDHVPMNQASGGIPNPHYGAIFYRGEPAVSFFFVLSGFLITYLLLQEQDRTEKIDVKAFYIRRILRIWPLYFLITGFGLALYFAIMPAIGYDYPVAYSPWVAVLLYLFFLPNLLNSIYAVGGVLNPLWSIGVEEQFYLTWAPVVRRFFRSLLPVCIVVFAVSFAISLLNVVDVFGLHEMKNFVGQLKFHFMAVGGIAAILLHRNKNQLLRLPIFTSRILRILFIILLVQFYFIGKFPTNPIGFEGLQLFLYPWLILEVSANTRRFVKIDFAITEWLGKISYGIYMYHMIVIYLLTWMFGLTHWLFDRVWLYVLIYYFLTFAGTILLSAFSYKYFESPLLALKLRLSGWRKPIQPADIPLVIGR